MINSDAFSAVKTATVAIGLANRDTGDILCSVGTGFFIGGEYIVSSAHVFSQCIKYNTYFKEKDKGVEGVYSAFNVTSEREHLQSDTYNVDRAIRLPALKEAAGFTGSLDLDLGIAKLDHRSDNFLHIGQPSPLKLYEEIASLYELTKGPLYGIAPIGLAYGVSNQILSLLPSIAKNYFEKNLPLNSLFQDTGVLELF